MSIPEIPGKTGGGVDSKRDISSIKKEKNSYPVNQIPVLLYEDLCRHLTLGDETEVYSKYKKYQVRRLNPNHSATGFSGAIGIEKNNDHVRFALWFRVPEGVDDSVFEPVPILEIDAGPRPTGEWLIGKGRYIVEDIRAKLPTRGITLGSESIRLISLILYRASELTRNPECIMDSYWENDKFPGDQF